MMRRHLFAQPLRYPTACIRPVLVNQPERIGVDTRPMGNGQDGLAWAVAAAPPHSGGGWEVQPPPVTPPVMVAPQVKVCLRAGTL